MDRFVAGTGADAVVNLAIVVRLGWQIGDAAGSNNMIDYLDRQAREHEGSASSTAIWIVMCEELLERGGPSQRCDHCLSLA